MVSVGAIIANRIRLLLLLLPSRRHNIPIQMVMVVRPYRLMRMRMLVDMILLGVVVVVEVAKCCIFRKRRRLLLLLLLVLVGMRVRISGKVLLGGYGREVVVGGCGWERRLGSA